MQLPFNGAYHSWYRGSSRHRRQLLWLLPPHPPPLLCLQRVEWHLRPSWHSLCAWMLTLILPAISCVRWTPMSVVSHNDRLWWVVSQWLPLLFSRHLRMRVTMAPIVLMMLRGGSYSGSANDANDGSPSDNEMFTWFTCPLSLVTKRGSSFEMRVVILIRGGLV